MPPSERRRARAWVRLALLLLVAASWGCSGEVPERPAEAPEVDTTVSEAAAPPEPLADASPDTGAPVFDEPVIVFATAGADELESVRSDMGDEDFYAMADDLMWYRAMAEDVLAGQDIRVARVEGRSGLRFLVEGEARLHAFRDEPTLDLIVLYRPGAEPVAVPPIELSVDPELVARYFADSVGPDPAPGR